MEGLSALEQELGAKAPEGLSEALGDDDLQRLAGVIGTARREQSEALRQASERSLDHVPRLLRGIVKRVVGA